MKLNLLDFFKQIENESYVVIKPSRLLPDYDVGSDIDIFCYHPEKISNKVTIFLSKYLDSNSSVSVVDENSKMHIDYIVDGKIHFRFDLYKSLPTYKNVNLKSAFFSSVIESAESKFFSDDVSSIEVKIPSMTDDLILRYVEYH